MARAKSASRSSPRRSGSDEAKPMTVTSTTDVLLFYPNIIGYARVAFMIASLYFYKDWQKCLLFYCLAFGGDVVDGYVARHFKQSSHYGATLDMVTDRVSTGGFLCMLASLYPEYGFYFAMLGVLDIASHWFHMASTAQASAGHKSEKTLENRNPILRWYYSIYVLFGYCCVGAEFFYILLYVSYYVKHEIAFGITVYQLAIYGCGPACLIKNIINVVQMCSACYALAERDADQRNDKK